MGSLRKIDRIIHFFMNIYRIQRYKTTPYSPLTLPLRECKIALITTAGFYLNEQKPFERNDCSYRVIPNSIQTQSLLTGHKSEAYDKRGIEIDPNLAFPLDRFRELKHNGKIGSLNHRHFSFMGSITRPRELITQTAPDAAKLLKEDSVDVVFLTPV